MPAKRSKLTAAFVHSVRQPGKYYDEYGLCLRVFPTGRRSWEQRITIRGRRRTLGLGSYPVVSLKDARNLALEHQRLVQTGGDPFAERRRPDIPTFADAALDVLSLHSPSWSSPRQAEIWLSSLKRLVFPKLGALPVSEVQSADVLAVLTPIWYTIPETARRVRNRIRLVMRWAIAQGYRSDDPAADALDSLLPRSGASKRHYRALPHAEVAAAIVTVRQSLARDSTKLLFEFLVLTASRSGEVRGARWSEINYDQRSWTVPSSRMKARVAHRVPLCDRALAILEAARVMPHPEGLIFPSPRGLQLSDATVSKLVRELGIRAVPHGFRSSFRDWCGETGVAREVAEACLAHAVANKVEAAYARSDLLDRRRKVMDDWAAYLAQCEASLPSETDL